MLVLVVLILFVVVYYISTHNNFIRISNKIDESLADIDVALERRYDTLTKLVSICKQYTSYEDTMLDKAANWKNSLVTRSQAASDQKMAQERIFALAEAFPALKAADTYQQLQKAVVELEEHLSAAKRMFNSNVTAYNDLCMKFPSSIIANAMGCKPQAYFGVDAEKRTDPKLFD